MTIPSELPDVRMLQSLIPQSEELMITIGITKETAIYQWCGKVLQKNARMKAWGKLRYLPVFGRSVLYFRTNTFKSSRKSAGVWP